MIFPLMMVMSMAGMFMGGGKSGKAAAELNEERKDYFSYLAGLRDTTAETAQSQRAALEWSHPDPRTLADLAGTRRMWERRSTDNDFCHVRVGLGTHRLATRLIAPETGPPEDLEPVSTMALRRFVATHSVVHALPTAVSLRAFPTISFEGDRSSIRTLIRAMVLELSAFHSPEDLAIVAVAANPDGREWQWIKWLPHAQHSSARDGCGTMRLMFPGLDLMEESLAAELMDRGRFSRSPQGPQNYKHLVVIIDDGQVSGRERLITDAGMESVTVLDLNGPRDDSASRRGLHLVVDGNDIGARTSAGYERFATPDQLSLEEAEATARALCSFRTGGAAHLVSLEAESRPTDPGLMNLLKVADAAELVPDEVWSRLTARSRLRVPVGWTPTGQPLHLDIKESAEGGMGPHGLCIGATGSGKSEFLRTLVLAMITSHSPEALNLILVDFKGGATFLGLDGVPHIAAIITNLQDELSMVDRMRDALAGEMNRRQELLRSAGNFPNVTEYERARAGGAQLDPLPALFIVVDEFSELLSQKPDFAELFVMIGRLGRSLHIHLLLASQRLEEGKLRGLDSHLSYRIGLKTFSAGESRSVLGVPDAYHLPSVPGSGYLKNDASEPTRFTASYVSGPYIKPRIETGSVRPSRLGVRAPKLFTATPVQKDSTPDTPAHTDTALDVVEPSAEASRTTLLDVVVDRLRGHGRPAHTVWLPPLDKSPAINSVLPHHDWFDPGNLNGRQRLPIGVVDRPYDQRRDVLAIDLAGGQGNVAVVGGPQSGKSTTLRTMMMAAAATHTPEQLQFYCLDFGGGTLGSMAKLPHVGSVAGRMDADRIRRTVAEITALLRRREVDFRNWGVESMREFRQRKAQLASASPKDAAKDPVSADEFGDVILMVDGWATIKSDFDVLEPALQAIAIQGLSYGIHLVVTASRWMEIRPAVKDMLGTRIELRMGDPVDSDIGRKYAELVPVGRPGRGMNAAHLHTLIGLPRLDSSSSVDDLPAGVAAACEAVRGHYGNRAAPPVRMLPHDVDRASVLKAAGGMGTLGPSRIAIGLNESELAPVVVDLDSQPHLVILGDTECGKTNLMRTFAAGLTDNSTPEESKLAIVDFRRSLLGAVGSAHLLGYATTAQACSDMLKDLAGILKDRLPPSDVTQQQLKDRSWWQGPPISLLIDDYDLIPGGSMNHPLAPIVEYLPQARDIGLRVVIARRMGGAGRSMMDPILGRMKDLSCNALIMSGTKEEGALFGYKAQPLPPGRGMFISRTMASGVIQSCRMVEP
jgi:DNA segregation ATPase FtsK/SpoIIIE, S-DNA-T family